MGMGGVRRVDSFCPLGPCPGTYHGTLSKGAVALPLQFGVKEASLRSLTDWQMCNIALDCEFLGFSGSLLGVPCSCFQAFTIVFLGV